MISPHVSPSFPPTVHGPVLCNRGLTLWLQNETFSALYKYCPSPQRHERLYLGFLKKKKKTHRGFSLRTEARALSANQSGSSVKNEPSLAWSETGPLRQIRFNYYFNLHHLCGRAAATEHRKGESRCVLFSFSCNETRLNLLQIPVSGCNYTVPCLGSFACGACNL